MKTLEVIKDGKKIKVPAYRHATSIWYHLEGRTYKYEMPSKNRGGAGASAEDSGVFTAPMPGKIMKVMVSKGQEVKTGEVLLVMEAMKMEYSIEAPFDGTIANLECSPDQQVALGDLLVSLEKID